MAIIRVLQIGTPTYSRLLRLAVEASATNP